MTRPAPKDKSAPAPSSNDAKTIEMPAFVPEELEEETKEEETGQEQETEPDPARVPREVKAKEMTVPIRSSLERSLEHETLRRQSADEGEKKK